LLPGLLYAGTRVVAGGNLNWKMVEGLMYLVSGLSQEYTEAGEGVGGMIELAMGYVKSDGGLELLAGRSLMFLARFEALLTAEQVSEVVRECVGRIDTPARIGMGKIYAIIALGRIGARVDAGICAQAVGGLVKSLESCDKEDLNQDVVGEVLSCLVTIIGGMQSEDVERVEGFVWMFLVKVWAGFSFLSDVYISGYIVELVEVFAKNANCKAAFEVKLVPCLASVLSASFDIFSAEESGLDSGARPVVMFGDFPVPV
jgi:hypothetical protein